MQPCLLKIALSHASSPGKIVDFTSSIQARITLCARENNPEGHIWNLMLLICEDMVQTVSTLHSTLPWALLHEYMILFYTCAPRLWAIFRSNTKHYHKDILATGSKDPKEKSLGISTANQNERSHIFTQHGASLCPAAPLLLLIGVRLQPCDHSMVNNIFPRHVPHRCQKQEGRRPQQRGS